MRLGIGDGPAPALEGLDEFDSWATERGLIVSRDYQWGYVDDDGIEWPGFWFVTLAKERKEAGSRRIWCHNISVDDQTLRRGRREAWMQLAELLDAAFERMIEENGATLEEERWAT